MGYIYQITQDDLPIYVGQTIKPIQDRWYEHLYLSRKGSGFEIHNRIKNNKNATFSILVLEETEDLDNREKYWIEKLHTYISDGGCNLTKDGQSAADSLKKPCYQYDINGKFIAEFESVNTAARSLGKNHCNISKTLDGKFNTTYGYRWSYNKVEFLPPLQNTYTGASKAVYQYDLSGNFIAKYSSTKEAARILGKSQGNISSAANGKRKTAYGYKWSYDYIMKLAGY